ncbi:3-dehydroquinate synthase [Legionella rubrilucens]|uniref:3-dehydroquinate synthase n=1 Tax=Legionella rubrilucens TaxID=458 RepID=A0A0W0XWY6_9GAMM|nr:3-dehydroquinate synthase [Legionella rubrilucens]KTD48830.1 3-dehydroquinate synthase [Legionella rubrilucens]
MAKFNASWALQVTLPAKTYPIIIGHDVLSQADLLPRYVPSRQVMIISNETVAPLYLDKVRSLFTDRQCDHLILPDGERYKEQGSLARIYDELIQKQHHRDTTLIALGGGVIGDMTGFAASTYHRGTHFIQIPTTLLAQVDASIGGKTAINHPAGKNLIGNFYQPDAVIIDLDTLKTLPPREFRAGLAEVIKYALLEGGDFFELVYQALKQGLANNDSPDLAQIVSECCRIKAAIVMEDEREAGQRALLNLGHTFAHALETYSRYQRWLHGEAVAIGLYCAAKLSSRLGFLGEEQVILIDELLTLAKLPSRIPGDIPLEELRAIMSQDKKIKNNKLRFILLKGIGDCYIDDEVTETALREVLKCAVEGEVIHVKQG